MLHYQVNRNVVFHHKKINSHIATFSDASILRQKVFGKCNTGSLLDRRVRRVLQVAPLAGLSSRFLLTKIPTRKAQGYHSLELHRDFGLVFVGR